MKIKPVDQKLHLAIMGIGLVAVLVSGIEVNSTLNEWAEYRERKSYQTSKIRRVEDDYEVRRQRITEQSELAQLAADKNINQYGSITLVDYICSPDSPPDFDFSPLVDPDNTFNVADRNKLIIGQLTPSGAFRFNECTK